jgi:uncharacterized protein YndB with AHSA1/START domain
MEKQLKTNVSIDTEKLQIHVSREFDAPREMVFKAHTDPALMAQWWGPRKYTIFVKKMDARPGGQWHMTHRGPDGDDHEFYGEYIEVVPPSKIVWTFTWGGAPEDVSVETATFEDLGGRTRITSVSQYKTLEALQGMAQSGMEEGMIETYGRLDDLLRRLHKGENKG